MGVGVKGVGVKGVGVKGVGVWVHRCMCMCFDLHSHTLLQWARQGRLTLQRVVTGTRLSLVGCSPWLGCLMFGGGAPM